MTSNNHNHDRALQQDIRAWIKLTGVKYTTALRQMQSPLGQGLFGTRVSARHLVATLEDHPVVGSSGSSPGLGENGVGSGHWNFDGRTDYVGLALIVDILRMFGPLETHAPAEVSSYSLKHTAERFLSPHLPYVTNGRLIWAAAALGLPIVYPSSGGLNVLIGVPEREHDYVSRLTTKNALSVRAPHYRPVGYTHLQKALDQCEAGHEPNTNWTPPQVEAKESAFHDWLMRQTDRDDAVGDFSSDYCEAVTISEHRVAQSPDELLTILYELGGSQDVYKAGLQAIIEWMRAFPSEITLRTPLIDGISESVPGFGAGSGTVERYEYLCPCSDGTVIEEHDNIPGFRAHNVRMSCSNCQHYWRFANDKPTRQWGLVPMLQEEAN